MRVRSEGGEEKAVGNGRKLNTKKKEKKNVVKGEGRQEEVNERD